MSVAVLGSCRNSWPDYSVGPSASPGHSGVPAGSGGERREGRGKTRERGEMEREREREREKERGGGGGGGGGGGRGRGRRREGEELHDVDCPHCCNL